MFLAVQRLSQIAMKKSDGFNFGVGKMSIKNNLSECISSSNIISCVGATFNSKLNVALALLDSLNLKEQIKANVFLDVLNVIT
jgi:hypothetical protein